VTAVVSIIAFLSMLALSFTRRRVLILCAFYFSFGLLTVMNEDTIPLLGGFKLYRIAYPFLFLSVLVRFFRDCDLLPSAGRWPLFSYLALAFLTVVSAFYTPYTKVLLFGDPASLFGVLVVMSLFWVSAFQIHGTVDTLIFNWTAAALSLVLSAWVIWTASQADFNAFRGGTNINENYESLFLLAGVFPVVNFISSNRSKVWKALLIATLFSISLGAFILASRGMIIATLLGVLAMVVALAKEITRRGLLLIGVILMVMVGGAILLPGGSNTVSAFQAPELGTLDERTIIWGRSLQHFMEAGPFQIFLGDGLSSSINVIATMLPEQENYHNVYLLWLMEQGILGLAVFLFFMYRIWCFVSRSDSPGRAMMLGWFVFLLVGGLSSTISSEHSFWIIMGVLSGTAAFSKPAREQNPQNVVVSKRILPAAT
jgi:O-antigen ligase